MAEHSDIEWTDATWNPITGCSIVSPGCAGCYAMTLAGTRLKNHPSRAGLTREVNGHHVWTGEVRFNEGWLDQPLSWKRPRRVFVCAHGDLFHENVPDEWIDRVFAVMLHAPQHTFQVLTKRSDRMRIYVERSVARGNYGQHPLGLKIWPLPNVWLGVSVERQQEADQRIPDLLATPAAVRFISAEPLLGPVNLDRIHYQAELEGGGLEQGWDSCISGQRFDPWSETDTPCQRIDWVIAGGESGPHARPSHPDWFRSLREQCQAAGVPFFFKQWGEYQTVYDRDNDDPDGRRCPRHGSGPHGRYLNLAGGHGFHGDRVCYVHRIGKKAAGAMLDGREWREMPA